MKTQLLLVSCVVALQLEARAAACSVFNVTTADTVIVGRNHDWFEEAGAGRFKTTYRLLFVPPGAGSHGAFYNSALFGEGPYNALFEGMNDQGVFAGVASVPTVPVASDPSLPRTDVSGLLREILETASSVEEAVSVVRKHSLEFYLGERYSYPVHLMLVDPSGASAVVEFVGKETRVLRKEQRHQHMTNFYLSPADPMHSPAWANDGRFATIARALERDKDFTVDRAMGLLREVAQTAPMIRTQTSLVYDLRKRTMTLVRERRFDERITFDLTRELARGPHTVMRAEAAEADARSVALADPEARLVCSRNGEVVRLREGFVTGAQLTGAGFDITLSSSVDGRWISFSRILSFDAAVERWKAGVFTVGADGAGLRQVTKGRANDLVSLWPRDGSGGLLVGRLDPVEGAWRVFITRPDASPGDELLVSDPDHSEHPFSSMKDGRIVIGSDREPGTHLFALTPARGGGTPRYQAIRLGFEVTGRLDKLTISPDERQVLFEMGPGPVNGVLFQGQGQRTYRADFDAASLSITNPRRVGAPGEEIFFARWDRDGKAILFLSKRSGQNQLYRFDPTTGAVTQVTLGGASYESCAVLGVPS